MLLYVSEETDSQPERVLTADWRVTGHALYI